jgi:hypothetical protein
MIQSYLERFIDGLPSTAQLRAFGLVKIPLLFLVMPRVIALDQKEARVRVPLNFLTKNHLRSMYFGALGIGADCVVAILALQVAKQYPDHQVVPIFKDFQANFLKRAETDVVFSCTAGEEIKDMIEEALQSGQRVTRSIAAQALNASQNEVFADFNLGLSLKVVKRSTSG